MAVYKQASPDGSLRWMVDFIWVDRLTGKKRRIRRAAKDRKGRPAKLQDRCGPRGVRDAHVVGHRHLRLGRSVFAGRTDPGGLLHDDLYLPDARVRLKPQTVDTCRRRITCSGTHSPATS